MSAAKRYEVWIRRRLGSCGALSMEVPMKVPIALDGRGEVCEESARGQRSGGDTSTWVSDHCTPVASRLAYRNGSYERMTCPINAKLPEENSQNISEVVVDALLKNHQYTFGDSTDSLYIIKVPRFGLGFWVSWPHPSFVVPVGSFASRNARTGCNPKRHHGEASVQRCGKAFFAGD
jgi:hypothetical protein